LVHGTIGEGNIVVVEGRRLEVKGNRNAAKIRELRDRVVAAKGAGEDLRDL
jgi:hypothetical protein